MVTSTSEQTMHTLETTKDVQIAAPVEIVFETLLEQLGPRHETAPGSPLPMKLEPWPGWRKPVDELPAQAFTEKERNRSVGAHPGVALDRAAGATGSTPVRFLRSCDNPRRSIGRAYPHEKTHHVEYGYT